MSYGELRDARAQSAETDARVIASAATLWLVENPAGSCPSVDELLRDGTVSPASTTDPWGSQYQIESTGGDVSVRSLGPDRVASTSDDIVTR